MEKFTYVGNCIRLKSLHFIIKKRIYCILKGMYIIIEPTLQIVQFLRNEFFSNSHFDVDVNVAIVEPPM